MNKYCSIRLFACFLLYLCSLSLFAFEPLPPCNPFVIASGALSNLTDDPSSAQLNPVSGEGGITTSVSYPYSMQQLSQVEIASVVNYQLNSMYASWQTLSNNDYNRQDIRLGFRLSYLYFRFGLGYKVMIDEMEGYGTENDDRLTAGIRFKHKKTTLDIGSEHAMPFGRDNSFEDGEFNLSLRQDLDPNLAVAAGFSTDSEQRFNYKVGTIFGLHPNLKAVASWESRPGRFGLGAIFKLKWFNLAYAVQTHPDLDWTHSIGISALFP